MNVKVTFTEQEPNIGIFTMPNEQSLEYLDCFMAGWNLARCTHSRRSVKQTQESNNKFENERGKPHLANNGMVDGWDARKQFTEALKAN